MTVCIAARAGAVIFGATDRMLSSGDVQFEPTVGTKRIVLSRAIFAMLAGDAGLQDQIMTAVVGDVNTRIASEPTNWWAVRDVADLYIKHYNIIRKKRAEDAILSPLYLNQDSFVSNQNVMNDRLVNDLSKELLNFAMPGVSAIFAGHDTTGPHIYLIQENYANSLESNLMDSVGFAAIGIGARHASSQFMFARHAWSASMPDTLFLTYYAKRKSEVAPGVGNGTDMVMGGPNLGTLILMDDSVINRLEAEYKKVIRSETAAFSRARGEIRRYVEELQRQAAITAAPEQAAPKAVNRTTSSNGAEIQESSRAQEKTEKK